MVNTDNQHGSGALAPALVAVATSAVLLIAGSPPADARDAAGVFPPWWDRTAVFAAASQAGVVRDLGAVPFIVTVRDQSGHAAQRLRTAGALFIVAPAGSAACIS